MRLIPDDALARLKARLVEGSQADHCGAPNEYAQGRRDEAAELLAFCEKERWW